MALIIMASSLVDNFKIFFGELEDKGILKKLLGRLVLTKPDTIWPLAPCPSQTPKKCLLLEPQKLE